MQSSQLNRAHVSSAFVQLFLLDQNSTTILSAKPLQSKFGKSSVEGKPFDATSTDCFADFNIEALSSIAFMGCSSEQGIGDYNAETFVKKFTQEFESQFNPEAKNKIEHIYLIGSEPVIKEQAADAIGQKIANEFFRAGFCKLQVHAIPNTEEYLRKTKKHVDVPLTMRVFVANKGQNLGQVNAFVFPSEVETNLRKLEEEFEKAQTIWKDALHVQYPQNHAQEEIIKHRALIARLKREKDEAQDALNDLIKEKRIGGPFFSSNNVRIDLLKPEFSFTAKIENEFTEEIKEVQDQENASPSIDIQLVEEARSPSLFFKPDVIKVDLPPEKKEEDESVKDKILEDNKPATMPNMMQKIVDALKGYGAILEAELELQPCFGVSSTKKYAKLTQIKNLVDQINAAYSYSCNLDYETDGKPKDYLWKRPLENALQQNPVLTAGWFRHYAKNLLTNLLNNEPQKGTQRPSHAYRHK